MKIPQHPKLRLTPADAVASGASSKWYSRGYLPHMDQPGVVQSIIFRLADSLPQEKVKELESKICLLPEAEKSQARREQIEHWLDAGMGSCVLRHPVLAQTVQNSLLRFDLDRYRLIAWCIMPNHVHALVEMMPGATLGKVVQSWKSYSGRWAFAHAAELGLPPFRGEKEAFWMREYWDRFIRSPRHLEICRAYIHDNPVKAGLCQRPEDWRWSSAFLAE